MKITDHNLKEFVQSIILLAEETQKNIDAVERIKNEIFLKKKSYSKEEAENHKKRINILKKGFYQSAERLVKLYYQKSQIK